MLEKMYFPHDISTFGPTIDSIFLLIFWITMVTWVLVTVTLVVFPVQISRAPRTQGRVYRRQQQA